MWLFYSFFVFLQISFSYQNDISSSLVITLTSQNFSETIGKYDVALVEFYASWCGHCKAFVPEYELVADKFKSNSNVLIAKIDADINKDIGAEHEIQGYPTLKFSKNKVWHVYNGNRVADDIVKFVKEVAHKDWQPEPEAVKVLTNDNFNETVEKGLTLVEFYAPWCGHCKNLAPKYEIAAKILSKSKIILTKVDATIEKGLAERFGVKGYPTLKIFRDGNGYEYKGPQDDADKIVAYMLKQVGDGSREIITMPEYKKYLNPDDITIFGLFQDSEDPKFKAYIEICNVLRDELTLLHTFEPDVMDTVRIEAGNIAMFQPKKFQSKYESLRFIYPPDDNVTLDAFKAFVAKWRRPLVGQITTANRATLYRNLPLCIAYYTIDWTHNYIKATQHWRSKILEVAKDYPDIIFSIGDENEFEKELIKLQLDDNGEEVNFGCYTEYERFRMEPAEMDVSYLKTFIEDFKNDKLKPILWSQPIPTKNDAPVKIVVAKSFDYLVKHNPQHVLIEFYAPWCGHCKQLEPIYTKLAKKIQNSNPDILIAKMDATANDMPTSLKVEGFPTIYLFKSGHKDDPLKYDGARTIEAFIKYLEEITGNAAVNTEEVPFLNRVEL